MTSSLLLWNLVKLMLDYMTVFRQYKLLGNRRTQIECSLFTSSLRNHDCRINCHWFTPNIAACFSTKWIIAAAKMKKIKEEKIFFIVSPTFSKYFISYSRMIPLGRSGSCQDKEMLFFAIFPFFTLVTWEGAAK